MEFAGYLARNKDYTGFSSLEMAYMYFVSWLDRKTCPFDIVYGLLESSVWHAIPRTAR